MNYDDFVPNIGTARSGHLHPGAAHNNNHAFDPDPDPYRIDTSSGSLGLDANYSHPHSVSSSHMSWRPLDEFPRLDRAGGLGNEEALQEGYSAGRDDFVIESDRADDLVEGHQHSGPTRRHYGYNSGHPDDRQREDSLGATSLASTAFVPPSPVDSGSLEVHTAAPSFSSLSPISLDSISESGFGSSFNLLVDFDPASSSGPASAASQELARPHDRSRPLEHIDVSHPPRRSSLTPTIHPNRRLPQPQYSVPLQNRPAYQSAGRNSFNHIFSSSSPDDDRDIAPSQPRVRPARYQIQASSDSSGDDLSDQEHNHRAAENVRASFAAGQPSSDPVTLDDSEDLEEEEEEAEEREDILAPHERRLHYLVANGAARAYREGSMPHPNRDGDGGRPTPALDWGSDSEFVSDEDGDDELIEVVLDRQMQAPPVQRQQSQQQRHPTRSGQARQSAHRHNNAAQQRQGVDVIDLTEEPESPVLLHQRPIHLQRAIVVDNIRNIEGQGQGGQQGLPPNPRRQTSQIARTPSLTRSDGSVLRGQRDTPVIDLTNSSDELDVEFEEVDIPADRRLPAPRSAAQRNHRRSVEFIGLGRGFIPGFPRLGNISSFRGLFPDFLSAHFGHQEADLQIIEAHQFAMNANPLAGNQPEFNYQANGFGGLAGRQPTPKPDFEPPPPARPGFTRHTGPDRDTNDEMVVVCASCDNELKYSAAAADDDGARPAKRPRNKKDREEHHFWAVKGCGHVYCRDCYENRRKYKSKDYDKLGFRVNYSYKTPKVFCAVDACDSDVTNNQSWVGIFI